MPLWRITYPSGLYTVADKHALARAITTIYTTTSPAKLPAFYVNVLFTEYSASDMFVGGEAQTSFVRFVGEHIARHMNEDDTVRMRIFMQWFDQAVAPFTRERGLKWEVHIDQTLRDLWTINGLVPPPADSEEEKLWRDRNAAVPYEDAGRMASGMNALRSGRDGENAYTAAKA